MKPQAVMAGQPAELVLTLTCETSVEPEAKASLALVAGSLVAPKSREIALELHRVGPAHAGVQRFSFAIAIPDTAKSQRLLLQLQARVASTSPWLPLPAVVLESRPRTWPETLRRFARSVSCARLEGGEHLDAIFQRAGVEAPIFPPEGSSPANAIRVGFAEVSDEFRPPPTPRVVWIVFKSTAPEGVDVQRTASSPACVVLNAAILPNLDKDANAQATFEQALALASVMVPSSVELTPSEP